MRKLNFKEILCGLLLSMCVVNITISCVRDNESPKPVKQETAPNPDILSIGINIADTEYADGTSSGALLNGIKYRAIVYKEDGSYLMHNDYTIGGSNGNLSFNKKNNGKYIVVVYSFNSTKELPAITDAEKGNIRSAVLDFDLSQGQPMYTRVENYVPSKSEDIKVKLKHMFVPFTLVIDNSATPSDFYKIEEIEYARIDNNQKGKISLLHGGVTERAYLQKQDLVFSVGTLPLGEKSSSTTVWLNVDKAAELVYKLKTNISSKIGSDFGVDGDGEKEYAKNLEDKEIKKSINIEQGNKHEETVTKQKCGAYISDTEFLEFMCQNLGATAKSFDFATNLGRIQGFVDVHPSVDENALGAKYQWGKKEPILTQDEEVNLDLGKIEWSNDGEELAPVKDDSAWKGNIKTDLDPCPSGYKIPSVDEIKNLFEYNKDIATHIGKKGVHYFAREVQRGGKPYGINAVAFGSFLLLQTNGYRNVFGDLRDNENKDNFINIAVASKPNDVLPARSVRIGMMFTSGIEKHGVTVMEHSDVNDVEYVGLTVRCVKE